MAMITIEDISDLRPPRPPGPSGTRIFASNNVIRQNFLKPASETPPPGRPYHDDTVVVLVGSEPEDGSESRLPDSSECHRQLLTE